MKPKTHIVHLAPRRFAEICKMVLDQTYEGKDVHKAIENALQHFVLEDGNAKWKDNAWYWPIYMFVTNDYAEPSLWIEEQLA